MGCQSDFGVMNRTRNQHTPMEIRFPTRIVENRPAYDFRIRRRCIAQKRLRGQARARSATPFSGRIANGRPVRRDRGPWQLDHPSKTGIAFPCLLRSHTGMTTKRSRIVHVIEAEAYPIVADGIDRQNPDTALASDRLALRFGMTLDFSGWTHHA